MSVPKISIYTASTGEMIKIWYPDKSDIDPCYSISYGGGGWMNGLYDSPLSAKMGAELQLAEVDEFYPLQKDVNHVVNQYRLLSVADLKPLMEKHNVTVLS